MIIKGESVDNKKILTTEEFIEFQVRNAIVEEEDIEEDFVIENVDLSRVDFEKVKNVSKYINYSLLISTKFINCDFHYNIFVKGFTHCEFKNCDFSGSVMKAGSHLISFCKFNDCNFEGMRFDSITFEDTEFNNSEFESVIFLRNYFERCKFNNLITNVLTRATRMKNCDFRNARILDKNFKESDDLDFFDCKF